MPRKIHGQGGKTGHQGSETHGRVKKMYGTEKKVKRALVKRERQQGRKVDLVANEIKHEITPVAKKAYDNTFAKLKEHGARPTALIKALAIDEWFIEQVVKTLEKKKIFKEELTKEDLDVMHYISATERSKVYNLLLEKGRSSQQIHQEVEKWKRRVPGIAKGHY